MYGKKAALANTKYQQSL